jgi:hypothetical protein
LLLGLLLTVPALAQEAKDVCEDRPDCTVKGTQVALKGHEVIELSFGTVGEFGTVSEEEAERDLPNCEQREWWLRRPDKSVVKLVADCTGGSGSEVDVEVAKNRFIDGSRHSQPREPGTRRAPPGKAAGVGVYPLHMASIPPIRLSHSPRQAGRLPVKHSGKRLFSPEYVLALGVFL